MCFVGVPVIYGTSIIIKEGKLKIQLINSEIIFYTIFDYENNNFIKMIPIIIIGEV